MKIQVLLVIYCFIVCFSEGRLVDPDDLTAVCMASTQPSIQDLWFNHAFPEVRTPVDVSDPNRCIPNDATAFCTETEPHRLERASIKALYVHFRLHTNYFLLPWKVPITISRRSILFDLSLLWVLYMQALEVRQRKYRDSVGI